MKTCLIPVRYSTKHLVSQFLAFSHWLRIETSENWKALNKKNKIKADKCRTSRQEERTPFSARVGTLLPWCGCRDWECSQVPRKEETPDYSF